MNQYFLYKPEKNTEPYLGLTCPYCGKVMKNLMDHAKCAGETHHE